MAKYSSVVEEYFQNVIKKSWTWNRLTEEEKVNVMFQLIGILAKELYEN